MKKNISTPSTPKQLSIHTSPKIEVFNCMPEKANNVGNASINEMQRLQRLIEQYGNSLKNEAIQFYQNYISNQLLDILKQNVSRTPEDWNKINKQICQEFTKRVSSYSELKSMSLEEIFNNIFLVLTINLSFELKSKICDHLTNQTESYKTFFKSHEEKYDSTVNDFLTTFTSLIEKYPDTQAAASKKHNEQLTFAATFGPNNSPYQIKVTQDSLAIYCNTHDLDLLSFLMHLKSKHENLKFCE